MTKPIIALFLLLPMFLSAQDSDLGNWWIFFGNKQLNKNWNWHHEAQYRNYNVAGDLEQLLLRTGIGRNLTENNNLLPKPCSCCTAANHTCGNKTYI